MRAFVRPLAGALSIACLTAAIAISYNGSALAQPKQAPMNQMATPQAAPPPMKQMALTDKQVEGVIAAHNDIEAIIEKASHHNAKPNPKVIAQLEAVAKKNGFASYDEYTDVDENISLVLGGFDPATKKYVGSDAVIKSQIAEIEADKKMSAQDKKQALAGLMMALKAPEPPVENKGNIDLVAKYYDTLAALLGHDQQ
jgi:hypothetical protein